MKFVRYVAPIGSKYIDEDGVEHVAYGEAQEVSNEKAKQLLARRDVFFVEVDEKEKDAITSPWDKPIQRVVDPSTGDVRFEIVEGEDEGKKLMSPPTDTATGARGEGEEVAASNEDAHPEKS